MAYRLFSLRSFKLEVSEITLSMIQKFHDSTNLLSLRCLTPNYPTDITALVSQRKRS